MSDIAGFQYGGGGWSPPACLGQSQHGPRRVPTRKGQRVEEGRDRVSAEVSRETQQDFLHKGACIVASTQVAGGSYDRLFLTPAAEKTKTQGQNSRKKLNLWEDVPSHMQNSRKKLKLIKFSPQNSNFSKGQHFLYHFINKYFQKHKISKNL